MGCGPDSLASVVVSSVSVIVRVLNTECYCKLGATNSSQFVQCDLPDKPLYICFAHLILMEWTKRRFVCCVDMKCHQDMVEEKDECEKL